MLLLFVVGGSLLSSIVDETCRISRWEISFHCQQLLFFLCFFLFFLAFFFLSFLFKPLFSVSFGRFSPLLSVQYCFASFLLPSLFKSRLVLGVFGFNFCWSESGVCPFLKCVSCGSGQKTAGNTEHNCLKRESFSFYAFDSV